jgi:antitoxin (DNA-binding transcriptional repressor) of toxin-antitoxin stability system
MKAVGVRELKAHLSRYLREVRDGEVVLVTDRGTVVAELRSPGAPGPESEYEARLRRLAAGGGLLLGERVRRPDAYPRSPLRAPEGTALSLLDELRGET